MVEIIEPNSSCCLETADLIWSTLSNLVHPTSQRDKDKLEKDRKGNWEGEEATEFKSFQRQELQPWQETSGGTLLA